MRVGLRKVSFLSLVRRGEGRDSTPRVLVTIGRTMRISGDADGGSDATRSGG